MRRLPWLLQGLAIGWPLWFAPPVLSQAVDVFVAPAAENVLLGDPVTVEIRLNTNGQSVCQGGVFLEFDTTRLVFVSGVNNTDTWNLSLFNVEPAQHQPGVVSLNVGIVPALNADNVLVSTLNFATTGAGTAELPLLFNAGREETQFWASDCASAVTTNRTGGSVTIQGPTPTSTLTMAPTATPTRTPPVPTVTASPSSTPVPSATPKRACTGDCNGSGEVTVDEIITLVNFSLTDTEDVAACPGVDQWCGPSVEITCIIAAVNNTLTNCPGS